MKKVFNLSTFFLFSVCILTAVSCNKVENMKKSYNFSHIEGMEGSGEWGISLVDAKYSVADILDMSDKDDQYIELDTDGTVFLVYSLEKDTLVTVGDVIDTMVGKSFDFQGGINFPSAPPVPLPGVQFDLYDSMITTTGISYSDYELDTITLREGKIHFTISHNCPLNINVELTSPNIVEADNKPFLRKFDVTQQEVENIMDLSGCSFMLTDSIITMLVHMTCVSTGDPLPNDMKLNFKIKLTDFLFKSIYGRFVPVNIKNTDVKKIDMGDLAKKISGAFTIYNPSVDVQIYNGMPLDANLDINTLALRGGSYNSSLLSESPAHIYLPASTANYTKVDVPVADQITFSSELNQFAFSAKATINTKGKAQPPMRIIYDQFIGLRASVKVPLQMKIDDFAFKDTMDFGTDAIDMTGVVNNLVLRLKMENGLPLSVQVQVYFCDSTNNMQVTDSLFANSATIAGGYDGPVTTVKYVEVEDVNQINRIMTSNKVIIYAKINTDGRKVTINKSQYLRCAISGKCNVDYSRLYKEMKEKDNNNNNNNQSDK